LTSDSLPPDVSRLVILPSYNSGRLLRETALAVLAVWSPVWVILDGTTDSSGKEIKELAAKHTDLRVLHLPKNVGKGGAVLAAMQEASAAGFTHTLIMDADGQHPTEAIAPFMALSQKYPEAMILGVPVFGEDAPAERVHGRRIGNAFANFETLGGGILDSLFGFRLYPIAPALAILTTIRTARRFDFDTELAVRLFWQGVRPINRPVPVHYPSQTTGGITHFRYLRDNLLLVGTHTRLCLLLLPRLMRVWKLRKKWLSLSDTSWQPDASPPPPAR
jgi:glycosyltransferase involved in cell wall biosynthesis